jgi:hypothetical protein
MPELVVGAAGMVAEDLHLWQSFGGQFRAHIVDGGRDDLRIMRAGARYAWHRAQDGDALVPVVDRDWTVLHIAEVAWSQAVRRIAGNWAAVQAVTDALHRSRRALTATDIRRIVGDTPPARWSAETSSGLGLWPDQWLGFWPRRHSRLVWRPAGRRAGLGVAATVGRGGG